VVGAEFNEWWALQERKLALLAERQYPLESRLVVEIRNS
jgi:hypothetical protein